MKKHSLIIKIFLIVMTAKMVQAKQKKEHLEFLGQFQGFLSFLQQKFFSDQIRTSTVIIVLRTNNLNKYHTF